MLPLCPPSKNLPAAASNHAFSPPIAVSGGAINFGQVLRGIFGLHQLCRVFCACQGGIASVAFPIRNHILRQSRIQNVSRTPTCAAKGMPTVVPGPKKSPSAPAGTRD